MKFRLLLAALAFSGGTSVFPNPSSRFPTPIAIFFRARWSRRPRSTGTGRRKPRKTKRRTTIRDLDREGRQRDQSESEV